jgi:hypothetical protein
MQATLKSKVSEIFTKYNFSREDAGFISEVLSEIDDRQDEKFQVSKELFLTQKDKTDLIERVDNVKIELIERIESIKTEFNATLYKTIFTVGIIQLLAIIGSVLAIINYMHK